MVINAADRTSTRLRADFTRIYNTLKYKVPDRVKGNNIVEPVIVLMRKDGGVDVDPGHP
jgi:transcriptional regulator